MKGGKGGTGRKRPTPKPAPPRGKPHDGPKRGAPKKDWGAMPKDELAPPKPRAR